MEMHLFIPIKHSTHGQHNKRLGVNKATLGYYRYIQFNYAVSLEIVGYVNVFYLHELCPACYFMVRYIFVAIPIVSFYRFDFGSLHIDLQQLQKATLAAQDK